MLCASLVQEGAPEVVTVLAGQEIAVLRSDPFVEPGRVSCTRRLAVWRLQGPTNVGQCERSEETDVVEAAVVGGANLREEIFHLMSLPLVTHFFTMR